MSPLFRRKSEEQKANREAGSRRDRRPRAPEQRAAVDGADRTGHVPLAAAERLARFADQTSERQSGAPAARATRSAAT